MRTPVMALLTVLCSCTLATVARATHDGGSAAVLRALVGEPARYAVFQHVNINVTTLACDSFVAVDLAQKTWNERVWSGKTDDTQEDPYDGADADDPAVMKAAIGRCLGGFGRELNGLVVHPVSQDAFTTFLEHRGWDEPELDDEGQPLTTDPRPASLRHLDVKWELTAKGPRKLYTDDCNDEVDDDGELPPLHERCMTYFHGRKGTWRLVVKDQDTGKRIAGTTLSVEPTELSQVLMGLSGDEEPDDVGLPTLELMSLQAFETEDHVFLFGTAAHEPTANGTYFPVAAFVPKRATGRESAYGSPRGCACEGGGGAPVGLAALVLGILGARAHRLRRAA